MIIDATESDWPEIEAIAGRAAVFTDEEMDALGAVWEEYVLLGGDDSGYYFLIERQDPSTLGFICYGPRDLAEGVCDLYYLAVDPGSRRQGVGRRLIRACEGEAQDSGARMVIAETSSAARHEPARSLYLATGYVLEAGIKDLFGAGEDLEIFVKRL
jgi:ribosomal protein S18 acetylase RimI-like enzyme